MPKIRTKRGAMKRFKLTGTKKIRRNKSHANHILTKKSSKRKRNLRKKDFISDSEVKRVRRMIAV